MMKKGFLLLLLSAALWSAASCHAAETDAGTESDPEESRIYSYDYALSEEEVAERYPDLSEKLLPFGKENVRQTVSAEGLSYFNEIRDSFLAEGGEEEVADEMFDFMREDRHFFPAGDEGLFAVYGYRLIGATNADYYDVFFLTASEETLLYSIQSSQVAFLGNGEKLMIVSPQGKYGVFCVLDRSGEIKGLLLDECEISVPARLE